MTENKEVLRVMRQAVAFRTARGWSQAEFWGRLFVSQPVGSKYELMKVPPPPSLVMLVEMICSGVIAIEYIERSAAQLIAGEPHGSTYAGYCPRGCHAKPQGSRTQVEEGSSCSRRSHDRND